MAPAQSRGVDGCRQRRQRGLALFIALALAAMVSSALVPLLHRSHNHGRSVDLVAAAHPAHGEDCFAGAPSAAERPAPGPASPDSDEESSCPICVFVKSGQTRGMILPSASQAPAQRPPVSALAAAPDRPALSSERPAIASPRAPPRLIG